MKRLVIKRLALLALFVSSYPALASNTVLSGMFDGSESKMERVPGTCYEYPTLGYKDIGTFQVSTSGDYSVFDAIDYRGADVVVLIYDGQFNPASPMSNLLGSKGIDFFDIVSLVGDHEYRLVLQNYCATNDGAWAITISGPGNVTASNEREIPNMTQGVFSNSDPVATTECGTLSQYQTTGPVQVSASGTYYFDDVFENGIEHVDVCLQVYTAPFDPENPNENRVLTTSGSGYMDFDSRIYLESDRDYYFVAQPLIEADTGEFFYVLAPPAPFRINKALAGAWFNPQTNGQGMFIDVYDNSNQMFVGWYTYELSRPVDGTAQLGEPGHRWLTALGPISGNQASLDVYLARGGAFDSVSPPIDNPQTVVGSMDIEFTDCMTGTVDYALTTPQVSGQIPVQPLAGDHVELCRSIVKVPGMLGPL